MTRYFGLGASFVRRLFHGEKRASDFTLIRLALAPVVDSKPIEQYPAHVPFVLDKLKAAQLSSVEELGEMVIATGNLIRRILQRRRM